MEITSCIPDEILKTVASHVQEYCHDDQNFSTCQCLPCLSNLVMCGLCK